MKCFERLTIYQDLTPRSAAMNMAVDQALLEVAIIPSIRFYKWDHPALSFGYFGKFAVVATHSADRDLVRRWTGGGIVFHGDDLTYSIAVPASDAAFAESSMSIYEKIHSAIRAVFGANGQRVELATVAGDGVVDAAVSDCGYNQTCFANPVRADVLSNGRKIAGAAQRRTRRGLLQQGSIQNVDLSNEFADQFASELCAQCYHKTLDERLIARAHEIAEQKYGAASWLQRR